MKAIVTLKNKDGSYDEVGMKNRTVVDGKTIQSIHNKIRRNFAPYGTAYRAEFFSGERFFMANPFRTDYEN